MRPQTCRRHRRCVPGGSGGRAESQTGRGGRGIGRYRLTVPSRRTLHVRFNELKDPGPIPVDTDYASVIESDVPVVVQHTRLDLRQAENALMTTIAYASD